MLRLALTMCFSPGFDLLGGSSFSDVEALTICFSPGAFSPGALWSFIVLPRGRWGLGGWTWEGLMQRPSMTECGVNQQKEWCHDMAGPNNKEHYNRVGPAPPSPRLRVWPGRPRPEAPLGPHPDLIAQLACV